MKTAVWIRCIPETYGCFVKTVYVFGSKLCKGIELNWIESYKKVAEKGSDGR